jgi:hypothetical protein
MFQAPARVWNQIAETQELRTDWAKAMFPLPQDLMDEEVSAELDRISKETGSPLVAAAYLVVMPLLWESAAIAAFNDQAGPLPSLPPVETVDDAMAVAVGDYPLTEPEKAELRQMLLVEPQPPQNG